MKFSENIKPISYLKANAAKIADELKQEGEPYIITQNGEAAMVVQSVREFEQTQETLAMLQMIAESERDIAEGRTYSVDEAFALVRKRRGVE